MGGKDVEVYCNARELPFGWVPAVDEYGVAVYRYYEKAGKPIAFSDLPTDATAKNRLLTKRTYDKPKDDKLIRPVLNINTIVSIAKSKKTRKRRLNEFSPAFIKLAEDILKANGMS